MNLNLGNYRGKGVTTNSSCQVNGHIGIIGVSGSGKSVQGCRLICDVVKQGGTVLAIDIHGTLADDQIFPAYKPVFDKYRNDINKDDMGIPCGLFSPICYADGSQENPLDTVDAITDILASASRLGCAQKDELREAIAFVLEEGGYEENGIQELDKALHCAGNKPAERVREKLHAVTSHNIFRPGEDLFRDNAINIFRLSRYSQQTQQMVAEILLSYIWRLALSGFFKEKGIYLFVDEFHNLPLGKDGVLAQMLSEGRKFGVNLILATQMLPQVSSSAAMQRLMQCGLLLYFKPAANCIKATARMINPTKEGNACRMLHTLEVGEFIAVGSFLIDGREYNDPLKVSAVAPQFLTDGASSERKGRGTVNYRGAR